MPSRPEASARRSSHSLVSTTGGSPSSSVSAHPAGRGPRPPPSREEAAARGQSPVAAGWSEKEAGRPVHTREETGRPVPHTREVDDGTVGGREEPEEQASAQEWVLEEAAEKKNEKNGGWKTTYRYTRQSRSVDVPTTGPRPEAGRGPDLAACPWAAPPIGPPATRVRWCGANSEMWADWKRLSHPGGNAGSVPKPLWPLARVSHLRDCDAPRRRGSPLRASSGEKLGFPFLSCTCGAPPFASRPAPRGPAREPPPSVGLPLVLILPLFLLRLPNSQGGTGTARTRTMRSRTAGSLCTSRPRGTCGGRRLWARSAGSGSFFGARRTATRSL